MVHLDDELLRYRRQIRGQASIPSRRVQPARTHQSLDLISVPARPAAASASAASAGNVPAHPPGRPVPPPPPPNPFLKRSAPAALLANDLAAMSAATPAAPDMQTPHTQMASPPDADAPAKTLAADTDQTLATGTASLDTAAPSLPTQPTVTDLAHDPSPSEEHSSERGSPTIADPAEAQPPTPELALQQTVAQPDGYLESSEALLKSLADEADLPPTDPAERPPTPYNPNSEKSSLPLKQGTLLLLLTASAAVGYAIVNPAVLAPARQWISERTAAPAPETASELPPTGESVPTSPGASDFTPPGPDLSAREFVDLDLSRLSTLEVDGTPSAPLPAAPTGQLPTPSTGTPAAPAASSPTTPETAATAPATAPPPAAAPPATTTPATTTPSSSTAAGGNYYVVTSFTGDASLSQARDVVSDAFVRNFSDGTYIQVAAFDNEASAQEQIKALQQRGLTVQLYGPTDE